jgi:hypothetical protein
VAGVGEAEADPPPSPAARRSHPPTRSLEPGWQRNPTATTAAPVSAGGGGLTLVLRRQHAGNPGNAALWPWPASRSSVASATDPPASSPSPAVEPAGVEKARRGRRLPGWSRRSRSLKVPRFPDAERPQCRLR